MVKITLVEHAYLVNDIKMVVMARYLNNHRCLTEEELQCLNRDVYTDMLDLQLELIKCVNFHMEVV